MSIFHEPMIIGACLIVAVGAALTDVFTRKMPNLLTLGGLAFGIVAHGAIGFVEAGSGGALRGILLALAGALMCGIVPAVSFFRGQMGGGDVKLFAAIGAMVGPSIGIHAQFVTFIIAMFILWPWAAVKSGALRAKIQQIRSKMRGESIAPAAAIKLPRVIMGPAILLGLCIALLRQGILPWS